MTKKTDYQKRTERRNKGRKNFTMDVEEEVRGSTIFGIGAGWLIVVILFIIAASGLAYNRFAKPFEAETRDITYSQSTQHIEGTVKTIEDWRFQLLGDKLSKNQKLALEKRIVDLAAGIDLGDGRVDPDLREYIRGLKARPRK